MGAGIDRENKCGSEWSWRHCCGHSVGTRISKSKWMQDGCILCRFPWYVHLFEYVWFYVYLYFIINIIFLIYCSETVPVRTVNRQCSSGLQAVADVAAAIKAGFYDIGKRASSFWDFLFQKKGFIYFFKFLHLYVGIGAGLESMTVNPMAWEGSVNPKVYCLLFWLYLLHKKFWFWHAFRFATLIGKGLWTSPELPSSHGYYFWKCCTSVWCD